MNKTRIVRLLKELRADKRKMDKLEKILRQRYKRKVREEKKGRK